jgi:hypothetical protein
LPVDAAADRDGARLDSAEEVMPYADHAPLTVKAFGKLIRPLRERARQLGYALGVHGTLIRDIDLIACPWSADAVPARHLAEAIRIEAERVWGIAFDVDAPRMRNPHYSNEGRPGHKPHGRMCWSFHLGGGPYIDLSVMPRDTTERPLRLTIFAYTALNNDYPAFLSINEIAGDLSVTVRAAKKPASGQQKHDLPGDTAEIALPRDELPRLIKDLQAALERGPQLTTPKDPGRPVPSHGSGP